MQLPHCDRCSSRKYQLLTRWQGLILGIVIASVLSAHDGGKMGCERQRMVRISTPDMDVYAVK